MKSATILFTIILLAPFYVMAHGVHDEQEQTDSLPSEESIEISSEEVSSQLHDDDDHSSSETNEEWLYGENTDPGWSDFPSMHPMVVHFPIVLLLMALLTQIAAFFIWKEQLSILTLIILLGGAIGAYVSSNFAHPHTTELNDVAAQLLTLHEQYAGYTKWLSIVAVIVKAMSHFVLKRKLWGEILVVVLLAGTAYSVSQAGHYGAALIHLHGIGPKGKFLENKEHSN